MDLNYNTNYHLLICWIWIGGGIVSGMIMGLYFSDPNWLGGYSSVPRRMIRLGHISFFGMAMLNFFYFMSASHLKDSDLLAVGGIALIIASLSMPSACFFCASTGLKRSPFYLPVLGAAVSAATMVMGVVFGL